MIASIFQVRRLRLRDANGLAQGQQREENWRTPSQSLFLIHPGIWSGPDNFGAQPKSTQTPSLLSVCPTIHTSLWVHSPPTASPEDPSWSTPLAAGGPLLTPAGDQKPLSFLEDSPYKMPIRCLCPKAPCPPRRGLILGCDSLSRAPPPHSRGIRLRIPSTGLCQNHNCLVSFFSLSCLRFPLFISPGT